MYRKGSEALRQRPADLMAQIDALSPVARPFRAQAPHSLPNNFCTLDEYRQHMVHEFAQQHRQRDR